MENITINDILYVLITVALPLVLRFVYQLVAEKVANSKYADAVDSIYAAVSYVNQTFVDGLKTAGSFGSDEAMQAYYMAQAAALDTMKASTYRWLEKTYDDLDIWLKVQIESAVKASKEVPA